MKHLFHLIFSQPIFNLLIALYVFVPGHSMGLAIILLTVLVKALLWPLSGQALRSQKALQDLQPKMDALKKEYGDRQEELGKAMMALYSKEKVSPFSSCLPLLIQLPVFIALYHAMASGLATDPGKYAEAMKTLYSFVPAPEHVNSMFLGIFDLAKSPKELPIGIILGLLAGVTQYFQAKMMITRQQPKKTPGAKDEEMLAIMNKQMLYMMPVLTIFISWSLPSGLALYWLAQTVLTIGQQYLYFHRGQKPAVGAGTAVSPEVIK